MQPMTVDQELKMRSYLDQQFDNQISYKAIVLRMKNYRRKLQKKIDDRKR